MSFNIKSERNHKTVIELRDGSINVPYGGTKLFRKVGISFRIFIYPRDTTMNIIVVIIIIIAAMKLIINLSHSVTNGCICCPCLHYCRRSKSHVESFIADKRLRVNY